MSEVREALERITAAFEAVLAARERPPGKAHPPFQGDFCSALPYPSMMRDISRWAVELRKALGPTPKCQSKASLMSLEEAILHAQEKSQGTSPCAAEHKQLASWLEELRVLRKAR